MAHMSNYLKNKVLNENLRDSTVYAALFSGDSEVSQPSYERQQVTFIPPNEGQTSNSQDVLFPIAEEEWGNITHIAVYDSQTGGNLLFKNNAEFVKTIDVSSQYKIPKNYLIIRLR